MRHQEGRQLPLQVGVWEQLVAGQCLVAHSGSLSPAGASPACCHQHARDRDADQGALSHPLSRATAKCWVNQCINLHFI